MKLLIELYGDVTANNLYTALETELPGMHEDYYIRNVIRSARVSS